MLQGTVPQEIKNYMTCGVRCIPACSQPAEKALLLALLLSVPAAVLSARVLKNTPAPSASYSAIDQYLSEEWCCSCEPRAVSSKGKCSLSKGSKHSANLKAKWKWSFFCGHAYIWEEGKVVSSSWGKNNHYLILWFDFFSSAWWLLQLSLLNVPIA